MGKHPTTGQRGSALVMTLIAVTVLAGLAVASLQLSISSTREAESARHEMRAFYLAEAGVSETLAGLSAILEQNGGELPAGNTVDFTPFFSLMGGATTISSQDGVHSFSSRNASVHIESSPSLYEASLDSIFGGSVSYARGDDDDDDDDGGKKKKKSSKKSKADDDDDDGGKGKKASSQSKKEKADKEKADKKKADAAKKKKAADAAKKKKAEDAAKKKKAEDAAKKKKAEDAAKKKKADKKKKAEADKKKKAEADKKKKADKKKADAAKKKKAADAAKKKKAAKKKAAADKKKKADAAKKKKADDAKKKKKNDDDDDDGSGDDDDDDDGSGDEDDDDGSGGDTTSEPIGDTQTISIGSHAAPIQAKGGKYWADIIDNGDGTYTVTCAGIVQQSGYAIEVVVQMAGQSAFDNAVFAGNTSGDPNFDLSLSGSGKQADEINGNVYSAGSITLSGDASVSGTMAAGGSINGGEGDSGTAQPAPDIEGMDYANTCDFDVANLFNKATRKKAGIGGRAYQVPESNPAHIFRRDPSDRSSEYGSTEKVDYFLEDPYETSKSKDGNGKTSFHISLSGGDKPGVEGSDKVYYIDGNLWLHNRETYSFKFTENGKPVKVTFVVKGNIYFGDDLFYENENMDGVAFIAIKDDDVANSGNIYFGDPSYGTLEDMHSYMYAENNFYDNNLDSKGSAEVRVLGNMSAGNQVAITRDYTDSKGRTQHSKLGIDYDNRMSAGGLALPGIPASPDSGGGGLVVLSWREVPIL